MALASPAHTLKCIVDIRNRHAGKAKNDYMQKDPFIKYLEKHLDRRHETNVHSRFRLNSPLRWGPRGDKLYITPEEKS